MLRTTKAIKFNYSYGTKVRTRKGKINQARSEGLSTESCLDSVGGSAGFGSSGGLEEFERLGGKR